jgi:hypothetical protein
MKNCDVLRKVPQAREYLAKIFKDLTLHKRPIVRERKPNTTRMIFVAGGYFQHSLDILEGYNVDVLFFVYCHFLILSSFLVTQGPNMDNFAKINSTSIWPWCSIPQRNILCSRRKKQRTRSKLRF